MENNQLKYTAGLAMGVWLLLLALHYLPDVQVGGHRLRRVDLLSEVRPVVSVAEEPDTLLPPLPLVKPAFVDTCLTGLTCIEDYSDSTLRGMTPFYRALDEAASSHRAVRIAFFGDSFIEADIMTADLREMLQKKYGGHGVGFVGITSQVYGFRPTVRHLFQGWDSHCVMDSVGFEAGKQGVSGHYFLPTSGAFVEFKGQQKYASLLDTCARASILFSNRGEVTLTATINQQEQITQSFAPSEEWQQMVVQGRIGSVRWTVNQADSAIFYGAFLEDEQGISVDNFSLRGSSGLSLRSVPAHSWAQFNRLRPYDLIILQYGLNVATQRGRVYDRYVAGMQTTLHRLKQAFPQAGILVVSVGDRDYKTDEGDIKTMPGIKNLVRSQQHLAASCGVAFWNLFEAMGGDGSMARLVEADPPMANLDYTHINFKGGKHLAGLLYETLVYGKEQYDRRRAYEEMP